MRTIIAHYLNDDEVAVRTIIAHCLNDDETWADYGLDQPNPVFTHEAD